MPGVSQTNIMTSARFGIRFIAYLLDVIPIVVGIAAVSWFFLGFDETWEAYRGNRGDISLRNAIGFGMAPSCFGLFIARSAKPHPYKDRLARQSSDSRLSMPMATSCPLRGPSEETRPRSYHTFP